MDDAELDEMLRLASIVPTEQLSVDEIDERVSAGKLTLNAGREYLGLPKYPISDADRPMRITPSGYEFLDGRPASWWVDS